MGMGRRKAVRRQAVRCRWVAGDPLMTGYHDREWGRPVRGVRAHFERMTLEIFQAVLNWRLLHKRSEFRRAFDRFDPRKVASYTRGDVSRLIWDKGIVRNRLKIEATIDNARSCLDLVERHGSFARYLTAIGETRDSMTKSMRKDFRFMGPLVPESYLQSVGLIRVPHERACFMHERRS